MAKCRALSCEGISAYHWAGGYRLPVATITGSVQRELVLLESCVGAGEIAVSDHRSSVPTAHELACLARCVGPPLLSFCRSGGCSPLAGCLCQLPLYVNGRQRPLVSYMNCHLGADIGKGLICLVHGFHGHHPGHASCA